MALESLHRLRSHVFGASLAHERGLQRVALRMAAQTVILLVVMLIVLEVVAFVIVRQSFVSSLETTLENRANQQDPSLCTAFRLSCGGLGPAGQFQGGGQPQRSPGSAGKFTRPNFGGRTQNIPPVNPSDASAVYVDRLLHVVHGDGALGTVLLSAQDARKVVLTQKSECCSVHHYRGQDYLTYSSLLRLRGSVVGVVQTSISENQYESTTRTLLQTLLVVALLGLVGSGGISVVLARRALQPIRLAMQRQLDFVADAAHELRTPLAIQRTVGEVGLASESAESPQSTIESMLAENHHLARLVDDLSLLARADSNAQVLETGPIELSYLVTDTTTELTPLAQEQGVRLTVEATDNLPVLGDSLRLRQLLLILLDNALKHTPAGGMVNVRLILHHGRARLEVIDSGPGIKPSDLPHIFDRFYQADEARAQTGSGLGLAIGRWIAEAHGGSIQADNAVPHGAVFTVMLPLGRGV